MNYLAVFVGGGLGSICRYGIAKAVAPWQSTFPYATLFANVLSCIVLGFFVAQALKGNLSDSVKLLVMVGFCGGFSTFSTFSNETFQLLQSGNFGVAGLNILGNVALCLGCIYLGMLLGK